MAAATLLRNRRSSDEPTARGGAPAPSVEPAAFVPALQRQCRDAVGGVADGARGGARDQVAAAVPRRRAARSMDLEPLIRRHPTRKPMVKNRTPEGPDVEV